MNYQQRKPPACLNGYVRYFWTLESNCTGFSPKTLGPLADGCPGIILQRAATGQFYDHDNSQLPDVFLYGQTVKRTAIYLLGNFKTTGVCFAPNALKSIFGFNANELTDSCLDMRLVSASLTEQLLNTPSSTDQLELLSGYLLHQIKKTDTPVDKLTHYALARLIATKGTISLKEMQITLNLSERSIERKFEQHVGISPKLFSRICRFQAALDQLKNNNYTKLSDIAFENGYADQSHFIRVFREFTGHSPQQFQKQGYEMVENFPSVIG